MTDTPNHGYNRPKKGATDWHLALNENFENIDADIEIRGTEADKSDYKPKQGAKYEATDSGAVYYGNGDTWVLADRKVESMNAGRVSAGELLKAGESSTAVVAPSVSSAFDSIQGALDQGFDDIILAEEITEGNILLERDNISITGYGSGTFSVINDPQDGNPVFHTGDNRVAHITLEGLKVVGGNDSGPAIYTNRDGFQDESGAVNWEVYNCRFRAGPIVMNGPRNTLRNVTCASFHTTPITIPWNKQYTYQTTAALCMTGATFAIVGGTYSNKAGSEYANEAAYISTGSGSITGGVTFTNVGGSGGGNRDILFNGTSRLLVGPCSYESSKEYNMQFGLTQSTGTGCNHAVILGASMNEREQGKPDEGFAVIKVENAIDDVTFMNPLNDIIFEIEEVDSSPKAHVTVWGGNKVRARGNLPHTVTHINPQSQSGGFQIGGDDEAPQTQTYFQVHKSEPNFYQTGAMALADGTNWDPDNDGNAEIVIWNGSKWVEMVDLEASI
ncbi:hypothetical protein ACOZ4L_09200 [Haloplanus ruber]|uniref:Uncharacterized protein n=1 Tax=Haloplanus ruber TaxID=869892 RepID=A0ABD6CWD6_9EURY|nr:hypothetical protein [Haloplanus ruber]